VKIVGTSGIEPQGASEPRQPVPQLPAAGENSADKSKQVLPSTEVDSTSYVQQALASADVDPQAVLRGRQLLDSGALDSPEAARAAAEAILKLVSSPRPRFLIH